MTIVLLLIPFVHKAKIKAKNVKVSMFTQLFESNHNKRNKCLYLIKASKQI